MRKFTYKNHLEEIIRRTKKEQECSNGKTKIHYNH